MAHSEEYSQMSLEQWSR